MRDLFKENAERDRLIDKLTGGALSRAERERQVRAEYQNLDSYRRLNLDFGSDNVEQNMLVMNRLRDLLIQAQTYTTCALTS